MIYPSICFPPRNSIHPFPGYLFKDKVQSTTNASSHQSAMALCSVAPVTPGFCDCREGWSIGAAAEEWEGIPSVTPKNPGRGF